MPNYSKRHGGPYDRGMADSWYCRSFDPHYYVGDTGSSTRVGKDQLTEEDIAAYTAGWDYNEATGDHKDWG